MPLTPGTRLGPYLVESAIGAGGMGEVYKATDTRLNRSVAIKALHDLFAHHPERVARFEREAQILAALNHPNIAAIHGLEEAASSKFLVLEFVEGRTLAEVIRAGAMPFADALAIAKQIADAVTAAHDRGIIHRDLKPGNVMLTPDGQVKVLDFGLGKSLDAEPGSDTANSPTLTMATQAGVVLGTAGYMSPEQAKGRPADRRSDVWAFGCVLYEMLTGRRAFDGEDITEILAAIVRGEPDWTRLPKDLPPAVRVLIERCLIKDRAARISDMSVVRFLMSDTAQTLSGAAVALAATAAARPGDRRRMLAIGGAVAAVAALVTFGITRWLPPGTASTSAVTHLSIALPDGDEMGSASLFPLALSNDGARVVYAGLRGGKTQIYVRALSEPTPRALDGTDGAESPFFSPDGQWIGFFAGGKLRKMTVGGATMQPLADAPAQRGGAWSTDGYIYYAPTNLSGLWRVPEGGGPAAEITHKDPVSGEISHRWPHVLADGRTLLFAVWTGPGNDEHSIAVQTIGSADHHVIVKGGDAPRYAATPGLLFYVRLGDLFVVPWQSTQTDIGRAVPIAVSEHSGENGGNEGSGNYAVSDAGTLAYLAGGRARNPMRLVWTDRAGKIDPLPLPERDYDSVTLSPDGTRAVVQIREGATGLWIYDLARNTLTPIGAGAGSSQAPVWTADGARILYRATRKGFRNLYWRAADGSGDEERLTTKPDVADSPTSVSPDGHWVVFTENGGPKGEEIFVLQLDGDHASRPLFRTPAGESDGQISPNGQWIAYEATVSSRTEIYVTSFPEPGPRRQVSADGGTEPLWSRDGRELFFVNGAKLMSVTVAPGAVFSAGAPRLVQEGRFRKAINGNSAWSVARDGTRFLRIQQVEPERAITHVDVVLNWFAELKPLLAGGTK